MNFLRRLVALFKSGTIEQDMDKEMRLHLDLLTRDHELSGMSAQEAQRAARRQFGNVLHIKERGRDIRGAGILGDVLQDVRYGARTFLHNPIFTAVIVLSLA